MSEHDEQYKLFSWTRYRPELRWMFAIPNGGYRTKATAGKMAAAVVVDAVVVVRVAGCARDGIVIAAAGVVDAVVVQVADCARDGVVAAAVVVDAIVAIRVAGCTCDGVIAAAAVVDAAVIAQEIEFV